MKSRREKGKGSYFFSNSKDKWIAKIQIDGKRKQIGSFNTAKEAKLALENYLKKVKVVRDKFYLTYTFKDLFFEAMDAKTKLQNQKDKVKKKKTCAEQYKFAFNTLANIHNKIFIELDFDDIIDEIIKANKGAESNRKIKIMLRMMYEYAFDKKIIDENPTLSKFAWVNVNTKNSEEKKHRYWTQEELNRIFTSKNNKYVVDIIKFLLHTGLRVNEFYNLKVSNIKLKYDKYYIIDVPAELSKTKQSRIIPIHRDILEIVKCRINDPNRKTEYLFETPSGVQFKDSNFRHAYFFPIMSCLKIENALPHDTRVTFKSKMDELEVSERYVEYFLGHTNDSNMSILYNATINSNTNKNESSLATLDKAMNKLHFRNIYE